MLCGRVIRCYHRCGEGQVWIQIRVVEVAVVPDGRDYGAHNIRYHISGTEQRMAKTSQTNALSECRNGRPRFLMSPTIGIVTKPYFKPNCQNFRVFPDPRNPNFFSVP